MLRSATLAALLCCLFGVEATEESPRIIIIGSGPSGLAAGTRLLENGFNNLTILEAEDRIGGRLYGKEFCGLMVDIGGQWVTGAVNNAAYDLVSPLGLVEKPGDDSSIGVYSSSGSALPEEAAAEFLQFYFNLSDIEVPDEYKNGSIGSWYTHELEGFFEAHPEIDVEKRGPLLKMLCTADMADHAGDDWFSVSAIDHWETNKDYELWNWKDKTYSSFIDILLKKYPNPDEELPFRNKTVLNAEVTKINYNDPDGAVRVVTKNGDEYVADHVIVTPSLGVLKADHEKLFNPPLPETKVNAIKGLEFGNIAKIYMFYPEPWWPQIDELQMFNFYWTDEDRNKFASDPKKSWLLGLPIVVNVEHKPGLLCGWLSGPHAREMENVPEEDIFSGMKEMLHQFLGKTFNLTEPSAILRTQWYSNKHFRGTYSYRSPKTYESGATAAQLEEPIMEHGKPRVLFAGEATSLSQYGTVNGAVSTGWREADRLIQTYQHKN
ncbi:spermine oxidase-like [Venturia canescens]|uniref:spermine oxidase-like n=1 Tax=Venturia canescens TaxID=32260 RepID=UPI001C9BCFC3|nr:spermine oxidase-like [Venturia canescens]